MGLLAGFVGAGIEANDAGGGGSTMQSVVIERLYQANREQAAAINEQNDLILRQNQIIDNLRAAVVAKTAAAAAAELQRDVALAGKIASEAQAGALTMALEAVDAKHPLVTAAAPLKAYDLRVEPPFQTGADDIRDRTFDAALKQIRPAENPAKHRPVIEATLEDDEVMPYLAHRSERKKAAKTAGRQPGRATEMVNGRIPVDGVYPPGTFRPARAAARPAGHSISTPSSPPYSPPVAPPSSTPEPEG